MGQIVKGLECKAKKLYPVGNGSHEIIRKYVGIVRVAHYKGHSGNGLAEVRLDVPK